uniref:Serine carboxypeptidase n=1 Tax=Panagrolaimus sp. PS1159 TaxID=55785 RepID=A0AC35G186_9BILA
YLSHGENDQTADKINYDNSDNQFGYPCYNNYRAWTYLSQLETKQAFHVDDDWIKANITWEGCNGELGDKYPTKYDDTTDLFKYIISNVTSSTKYFKDFKILIYNGDADTVCNFLGDSWFIDGIAKDMNFTILDRIPWIFRNQYAGYNQPYYTTYNNGTNNLTIDVLTVKGAGHLVAGDKQGPTLQMIVNFIRGTGNYSSTDNFDVLPKPQPGINYV